MSSEHDTGVRVHLRKFVESTSLRGVSRIFKSGDVVLRILWTLAVASCAAMLVYQLTRVISQYLRYEFSTVSKEDIWSQTNFPDVTICNVHPFGHSDESSLTFSKYIAAMTTKKDEWPYERLKSVVSNLTVQEYDEIWGDLFSHFGFVTNLMPNIKNQVRESQTQQLIVDCRLFDKDWNDFEGNCKSALHFHWDQTYQKCYTIRIPHTITEDIMGMTAIIYLDNLSSSYVKQMFHTNIRHSLATGARVVVHAPTTLPFMKRGITVSPGVETTIEVTEVRRVRLPQPWGTCTAEQYLVAPAEDDKKQEGVRYTPESCSEICKQQQYLDRCGCVIPIHAFTDVQLRRTNQTICAGQTTQDGRFPTSPTEPHDGFRTLLCLLRLPEVKPCQLCHLPCDERIYDVAVSTSGPWPHQSYRRAFYDQFVSGSRYAERLNRFAHDTVQVFLNKLTNTSNGLTAWNMSVINKPTVFMLNVVLKRNFPMVVEDKPAMTPQILLSNVGGVLSLWLGLTVMFFVEIIDLIIHILRQPRQPSDTDKLRLQKT